MNWFLFKFVLADYAIFMVMSCLIAAFPSLFAKKRIRFLFRISIVSCLATSVACHFLGVDLHAMSCSDLV